MVITELQSALFRALSHPGRVKILDALRKGDYYVTGLAELLNAPQPQVSRELINLKTAGILDSEKHGTRIMYRVRNRDVFRIMDIARAMVERLGMELAEGIRTGSKTGKGGRQ
jgi:DNA-binding transcriptional ArsR family regulator